MKSLIFAVAVALLLVWSAPARAVFLDPYDNALFADGFYLSVYANMYRATDRADAAGNRTDADYTALTSTVRTVYYKTLGKTHLVLQAGIPFGEVTEKKLENKKSSGLGDIWFGPGVFLYSDANSQTYLSYWFYAYAPTGKFDRNCSYANVGWNHWFFENQLAFSKGYGKFIYDMNLNHFFHNKEKENQVETPDRVELEASLGYQITSKFLAGFNLAGHWDLGNYKIAGVSYADSGATRYEIGPVLGYNFTDKLGTTLRWNHDLGSKNDYQGDNLWLRISYTF